MDRLAILRRVGWGFIYTGALVLAFLGYQLFVTDIINGQVQAAARSDLADELDQRRTLLPEPEVVEVESEVTEGEPEPPQSVELIPEEGGEEGSTLGRLVIPDLEVDEVIFEGVSRDTLQMGPGHMPTTPVPGQPGNAVVSGHRTTYGRPFYELDKLESGDIIEIETATGKHVYEVRRTLVVEPTDVHVIEPIAGAWLTLTTCHPAFSAAERLIVQAELVDGPNLEYANIVGREREPREERT